MLKLKNLNFSLQKQILLGLIVGVAFLTGAILFFFNSWLQSDLHKTFSERKAAIETSYKQRIQSRSKLYSMSMEVLLQNSEIKRAFMDRDRKKLKELLYDLYSDSLKPVYGISQFQFHLPNAVSFLRLHKPEKFGDDLSSFRYSVVDVNKTHKPIRGVEIGKYGPGVRIVYPVEYKGEYLGSVEFGASINNLLDYLKEEYSFDYAIGIKKNIMEKTGFKSGDKNIVKNDIVYVNTSLNDFNRLIKHFTFDSKIKEVTFGKKSLFVFKIPIHDYSGNNVGYLGIIKNITKEKNAMLSAKTKLAVLILGISFFFFILTVIYMKKSIITPLTKTVEFAQQIKDGNFSASINHKSRDEIGKLVSALTAMKEDLKKMFEEVKKKSKEAEEAANTAEQSKKTAEENRRYLSDSVKKMLGVLGKFSDGDLTVKLTPPQQKDDIHKLFAGFNKTVVKFGDLINRVNEAVQATASATTQTSSSMEEMAAGANEQASQTNEAASAIEQMTESIQRTADNAESAAEASKNANEQAETGVEKIVKSKNGMKKIVEVTSETGTVISSLADKSKQIGAVTQVINDIAEQTNLLALNAAIEAARAGEQGRGFAVVADEVRKLAERTTKATKEIADTIKAIQNEARSASLTMEETEKVVSGGMELISEVEEVFGKILRSTTRAFQQIGLVASATNDQSSAATEIAQSIETINNVTSETTVVVQQVAGATEDLNKLTENLQDLLSAFKLNNALQQYERQEYFALNA